MNCIQDEFFQFSRMDRWGVLDVKNDYSVYESLRMDVLGNLNKQ